MPNSHAHHHIRFLPPSALSLFSGPSGSDNLRGTMGRSNARKRQLQHPEESISEGKLSLEQLIATESAIRSQQDHRLLGQIEGQCFLNVVWREKVAQWCYDVIDHLGESRSLVYIAMNILDRFCAVQKDCSETINEKNYEMFSMTAIFLAVRISGSGKLQLRELVSMSRFGIDIQAIVTAGNSMIRALTWDQRLVTPQDFVQVLMGFVPISQESSKWNSILESASYLVEIAVCDASLSRCRASEIALAAMMNASRAVLGPTAAKFYNSAKHAYGTDTDSDALERICQRLQNVYGQSADNSSKNNVPHVVYDDDEDEPRETVSSIAACVSDCDLVIVMHPAKEMCGPRVKRRRYTP